MENKNNEITTDVLNVGRILICALKAQINGTEYEFPESTDFKKVYKLAEQHRVTSLVAPIVSKCGFVPDDVKSAFQKQVFRCVARYTAQEKEMHELSKLLSAEKIRKRKAKA